MRKKINGMNNRRHLKSVRTLENGQWSSFKGAYFDICMKINMVSKLAQYLTNLYKMRILMSNSLKYTQQCQKWSI